jgi:hypothetical protein
MFGSARLPDHRYLDGNRLSVPEVKITAQFRIGARLMMRKRTEKFTQQVLVNGQQFLEKGPE